MWFYKGKTLSNKVKSSYPSENYNIEKKNWLVSVNMSVKKEQFTYISTRIKISKIIKGNIVSKFIKDNLLNEVFNKI